MATGVVRWFSEVRGYGFIEPSESASIQKPAAARLYVHCADIVGRGYRSLRPGQPVRYTIQSDGGGVRAVEVEALQDR